MELSSYALDKFFFQKSVDRVSCFAWKEKWRNGVTSGNSNLFLYISKKPIDMPSIASSKIFHIFAIANYWNELNLIMICIMNCGYSVKKSRKRFFKFIEILFKKDVNPSEILSVNSLNIIDIQGIADTSPQRSS